MIRKLLAGFHFNADDTLFSPELSMLLALDFLTVFSKLDQPFTTMYERDTKFMTKAAASGGDRYQSERKLPCHLKSCHMPL